MRFHQEGDWLVSTPIFIGSSEEVARAGQCQHGSWSKINQDVREGMLLVMERCASCVAQRSRYRPVTEAEQKEW